MKKFEISDRAVIIFVISAVLYIVIRIGIGLPPGY